MTSSHSLAETDSLNLVVSFCRHSREKLSRWRKLRPFILTSPTHLTSSSVFEIIILFNLWFVESLCGMHTVFRRRQLCCHLYSCTQGSISALAFLQIATSHGQRCNTTDRTACAGVVWMLFLFSSFRSHGVGPSVLILINSGMQSWCKHTLYINM